MRDITYKTFINYIHVGEWLDNLMYYYKIFIKNTHVDDDDFIMFGLNIV